MNSLHFFVWNIRGIRSKWNEIEHHAYSKILDLIALTETWLEDEVDTRFFQGYNCIRRDRASGRASDLLIYLRSDIIFEEIKLSCNPIGFELIAFSLFFNDKKINLCISLHSS